MTESKIKAKELIEMCSEEGLSDRQAKECALFIVEEIRKEYSSYRVKPYLTLKNALELRKYWDDVLFYMEKY